jgi:hypothetical protein
MDGKEKAQPTKEQIHEMYTAWQKKGKEGLLEMFKPMEPKKDAEGK